MTKWQSWVVVIGISAVAASAAALLLAARAVMLELPIEARAARADLVDELEATRHELLAELNLQAKDIRGDASTQIAAMRQMVDQRTGDALALVDRRADALTAAADAQLDAANATLAGIRTDLSPALQNSQRLIADTDKAVNDLHPQLLGLVAASKVTAGETAQTMRQVKDATPAMVQSVQSVAKSFDGIAADVKKEADDITKPKTWWQKVLGPVYTAVRLAAAFF